MRGFDALMAIRCAAIIQTMTIDNAYTLNDNIACFRGTLSFNELLREFKLGQSRPYDNCESIHTGFYEVYSEMRDDVLERVASMPQPVTLCGHSLGGVLAVLCAKDIARKNAGECDAVYTFGCPKIGNRSFSSAPRNFPIFRVYNKNDIVTRVPPLCHHVGTPFELTFKGDSFLKNHELEEYITQLSLLQI